jgi:putative DNA primase/helicase
MLRAAEIAERLADQIEALAPELLPAGHREGHEWRAGNVHGDPGASLGVCLRGRKAGVWCDFASGEHGDALDLVRAVLNVDTASAAQWGLRYLGLEPGAPSAPRPRPHRPASAPAKTKPDDDLDRVRRIWKAAHPIAGTIAERYLAGRGLRFDAPDGNVLRFVPHRARKSPGDELEYYPAMLALLSDVRTARPRALINIYLRADGTDRVRDRKGKTCTGRAGDAAVMLSPFEEVTMGLAICEGVETGIAILQSGLGPVWCCGGAGNISTFPVLAGIECLTIAADADKPGQDAACRCAERWQAAGREVLISAPAAGDWADVT